MKQKQKAISPIVATILLVVVAVILVVIILSWGKDFTNKSLNKTNNIGQLKVSDATYFVYPKIVQGGGGYYKLIIIPHNH